MREDVLMYVRRGCLAITAVVASLPLTDSVASEAARMPLRIDPSEQQVDHSPPSPPRLELLQVHRGQGSIRVSATIYQSSASDNRGTVSFGVSGATDDRTPVDGIGYRIMFIDGEFPVGLVFDKVAFMPESGRVWLGWNDDNTWDQEPFLFRAVVTAVDRAGNESVPSNVVIVGHTGDTSWHKANPDPYTPITSGSTIAIRDEWKRAVRIEDVYRPSTLELIEKIESARIDPAVIIEEEKEIPEGRELSDDEVLQLQSILLDPANFARSPTMCEFIPAYTFAVTSKQDMRISFATNCNLIAIEIDEERREGVIFPLVSPMIQAFCEGLLTLPPLDSK